MYRDINIHLQHTKIKNNFFNMQGLPYIPTVECYASV